LRCDLFEVGQWCVCLAVDVAAVIEQGAREVQHMHVNVQQADLDSCSRWPTRHGIESANIRFDRPGRLLSAQPEPARSWLVDLIALAHCRELFAGTRSAEHLSVDHSTTGHLSFIDVPVAYDNFCRTHFGSVKRLHPEISWEVVCPVYAIALIAHSMLHVELSEDREKQLDLHWPEVRGQSTLAWSQARSLIADGCRALARLDPLANSR
jgi:hypothetical protein